MKAVCGRKTSRARLLPVWNLRQVTSCAALLTTLVFGSAHAAVLSGAGTNGKSRGDRTNSRFLRTFPAPYFNRVAPPPPPSFNNNNNYQQRRADNMNEIPNFVNGNSPVFYIRLPPAPYVLVPGLGYVSPHPYNTPMSNGLASSVLMNGMSPAPGVVDLSSEGSSQPAPVISLPLKFISNGRPAIIESVKKPSKFQDSKGSALISGGKYSFNGRPTAVFVVRSPA